MQLLCPIKLSIVDIACLQTYLVRLVLGVYHQTQASFPLAGGRHKGWDTLEVYNILLSGEPQSYNMVLFP